MKRLNYIATISVLASTAVAYGQTLYEMRRTSEGQEEYVLADPDLQTPQAGFHAYDNWRSPSVGGSTIFGSAVRMGGAEVADELFMTTSGPSLFTDFAFTIANTSTTEFFQSVHLINRIYDGNRTLLFAHDRIINIPIPPGGRVGIFSDSNVYGGFGIILPPHVFVSMQFTDGVGGDAANLGFLLAGPRTTGYSDQFAYNFTSGETLNFDGSDQTNMGFFIDTAEVPAPSAAAILCLSACSVACRRRR